MRRRPRCGAVGESRLTDGAGPSVRARGAREELGEAILTEGGMGLRRAQRGRERAGFPPCSRPHGPRRVLAGFWRAGCRPSQRLCRSLSHARLRSRAAAVPQQEAEGLGAWRSLRTAALHQAVRERLRPVQGLRAGCGLRSVQVREGEGTAPAAGAPPPSASPGRGAPAAGRALVASCRAESLGSLAGRAGEEARADLVVAPLHPHP